MRSTKMVRDARHRRNRSDNNAASIAIVSDLHCCVSDEHARHSFLIAGSKRTPIGQHLVQSLLELIHTNRLNADALICPGDLAHQVCQAGMLQAWDHLGEIQRKLNSPLLLPTVGNHDVDSRQKRGLDPFDIPKSIHPEFPRPHAQENDMFWQRGFYHVVIPRKAAVIVLNTVLEHQDAASAERGTFGINLIAALKEFLAPIYCRGKNNPLLRVAVMHHHPIVHSTAHYGSRDALEFGDQILNTLGDFGFRFIIHGHRHEPRITRYRGTSTEQLVFAAGAFSAHLHELATRTKNLFHLVELSAKSDKSRIQGRLRSWEFTFGSGWKKASLQSAAIPHEFALESPEPNLSLDELISCCDNAPGNVLRATDVRNKAPKLLSLLPSELANQMKQLRERGYKIACDEYGQIIEIGKVIVP